MDFELFPLVVGMAVGGLFGAKGKGVMKAIAKGYLVFADRAREVSAGLREDMRDAIEEARYERDQEAIIAAEQARQEQEQPQAEEPAEQPKRARRAAPAKRAAGARRAANADGAEKTTRTRRRAQATPEVAEAAAA